MSARNRGPSRSRARRRPSKPRLNTSAMIASIAGEGSGPGRRRSATRWPSSPETRPEIVGMTADLGKYTDLHVFAKEYPDRFYQMGMAEQLLMGAAAGMAHEGFMPFATTYAVFAVAPRLRLHLPSRSPRTT